MANKVARKKAISNSTMVINFRVPDAVYQKYVKKYPTFIDRKKVVASLKNHFESLLQK